MRVHPFVDEGLGHSSYLIDLGDGTAALIDPPRFPAEHEARAASEGLRIVWTIDTHSHADYVTGSPDVVRRHGAMFLAPEASCLATSHRGVHDGERIELAAGVTLRAVATPGHTADHHAYIVAEGARPRALFSGGSLMVGAVGRTDLCGPGLARPLAHEMFRGLRRFDDLPDDVALYPTHGTGSFCAAPGGTARTSTLGAERATNPLLGIDDEATFVERLLAGFGSFPPYFARLPEVNRRGPAPYDNLPELSELSPAEAEGLVGAGAVVIDVRSLERFSAGHLPGSISNVLRPMFGTWVGWLVEPDTSIVFVFDDDQFGDEVVHQCLDVGHERLAGVLAGGVDAWRSAGGPVATIPLVEAVDLRPLVIDVRQHNEFAAGHVPGARNIELGSLRTTDLASDPVTLMCGHGERAMTGASMLVARGVDVDVLNGGPDGWRAANGRELTS